MANTELHQAKVEHNRKLAQSLEDEFADWIVTVAFYAAVHKVEAMFYALDGTDSGDHDARNGRLRRDARFHAIHGPFKSLYSAARMARYDCPGDEEKETRDPLFPPKEAREKFLGERLDAVCSACDKVIRDAKK